jgi:hypothetical protein
VLEKIPDTPEGVVAYTARGKIGWDDYVRAVEPAVDDAQRHSRRLRILLEVGPAYEGFTPGALWGKTETWMRHPHLVQMVDGYALVTDQHRLRESIHLMAFLLPFPVRVFGVDERAEALAWLAGLPDRSRPAGAPQAARR